MEYRCNPAPVNCTDNNACTVDQCVIDLNGQPKCAYSAVVCTDSHDLCNPYPYVLQLPKIITILTSSTNVCDPAGGCKSQKMMCNDGNMCTTDSCAVINGTAQCQFIAVDCTSPEACFPRVSSFTHSMVFLTLLSQVCNASNGQCYEAPVVCDDSDPVCFL